MALEPMTMQLEDDEENQEYDDMRKRLIFWSDLYHTTGHNRHAWAGVTLVKGDLTGIVRARKLSNATIKNTRQNLFCLSVYAGRQHKHHFAQQVRHACRPTRRCFTAAGMAVPAWSMHCRDSRSVIFCMPL